MNEQDIFEQALEQASDERHAFLSTACAGDIQLQLRVEQLLHLHEQPGQFFERPAGEILAAEHGSGSASPGDQIGPYKLLHQIGEGGMGTVFVAEQTSPVRRRVALKVIRPGMDSRPVIARFEAERQALAMMDHVNIARVLDAGATDNGRPYFVMEFVPGVPITRYCDDNHLTLRQRLELFVPVCHAIQHSHQKGIIHRDIKPSNVLVTLYEGRPVPKVIDFGVARATEQRLTERTLFTQAGTVVGTLEYMSPEQAEMSGLGVDTRSDIYSLGVLLYELLTGSTPLSSQRMRESAYIEILRLIREEDPPRPSARLSDSGEALASISAQRQMDPAHLTRLMRGELDWIVMKCLEKDRNRRYETANAFAADVCSYLCDEPVHACPPSVSYRLRKFLKRNRRAVVLSAVVIGCIVILAGGAGWIIQDRAHRRGLTEQHVQRALDESLECWRKGNLSDALAAGLRAQALLDNGGGSEQTQARIGSWLANLTTAGRLDDARLESTAINDVSRFDFDATVQKYQEAFRDLGIDLDVLTSDEAARRIRDREIRTHLTVALDHWASLPVVSDDVRLRLVAIAAAADDDEWRRQLRQGAAAGSSLTDLAVSPETASQPPASLILLSRHLRDNGDVDAAIQLIRNAQRRLPDDFWLNLQLADLWLRKAPANSREAIRFLTAAVALRPDSAIAHVKLGMTFSHEGLIDEALACHREALRRAPRFTQAHLSLGRLLNYPIRDYNGAIQAFTNAIECDAASAHAFSGRGYVYLANGLSELAHSDLSTAISLNPALASSWFGRGATALALGMTDAAINDFSQAILLHDDYLMARQSRARARITLGQPELAVDDFDRLVELEPQNSAHLLERGHALRSLKRWEAALGDFTRAIEMNPEAAAAWQGRGQTHVQSGHLEEAVRDFTEGLQREPKNGGLHSSRARAWAQLGRWSEAAEDFARLVEIEPGQPAFWYDRAVALLAAGDTAAYRAACTQMINQFQFTTDPETAGHVASSCVIDPGATIEPAVLIGFADRSLVPGNAWNRGLQGAACCRSGQPRAALEHFESRAKVFPLRAWDLLFMAMAHEELGEAEAADGLLAEAEHWIAIVGPPGPDDESPPRPRWYGWQDQVVTGVLLRAVKQQVSDRQYGTKEPGQEVKSGAGGVECLLSESQGHR